MKRHADNPAQMLLIGDVFRQPDGKFLVVPRKPTGPIEWASTSQVADLFGVDASTVRRWAQEGKIPEQLADGTVVFRKRTPTMWEFNLAALEAVRATWTQKAMEAPAEPALL